MDTIEYHLRASDELCIKAITFMLRLAHTVQRDGTRRAVYLDLGGWLQRLRDVPGRDKMEFAMIIERECGLCLSRAYELMAAAGGRKPIAEQRARKAAAMKKHRRKQAHPPIVPLGKLVK